MFASTSLTRTTVTCALLLVGTTAHAQSTPAQPQPAAQQSGTQQPGAQRQPAPEKNDAPSPEKSSSEWGVSGPYQFDMTARLGGAGRLDDPPRYALDRGAGPTLGFGLGLALSKRVALGLSYEYVDFGTERSGVLTTGVVNIERELNNVWLDLKLYPLRFDPVGVYLALGVGLSIQGVAASASIWQPQDPGTNTSVFCSATDSPGFAFQGAVGIDAVIGPGVRLFAESGLANHRLGDEVIDGCVSGAGTATVLAVRSGLGYAWEL